MNDVLCKKNIEKEAAQGILQTKWIKIQACCNPMPKTDADGTSGKNLLWNRLVRLAYEFSKSIIETSNKIYELKTYNEAISDLIHENR